MVEGSGFLLQIKRKLLCWMIRSADSLDLSEIVQAVVRRYGCLFAEEEVVFLSMPKHDREERRRIIQGILNIEENRK